MKKDEFIAKYGEEAYKKQLAKNCLRAAEWHQAHQEEHNASKRDWRNAHPEEVKARNREICRKGGKYYDKMLKYKQTDLQRKKNKIRKNHNLEFREIKDTLAEEVELHHEWIGDTAEYRGVGFVEKVAHQHGYIDVILLLDGEITLFTGEEVKNGDENGA